MPGRKRDLGALWGGLDEDAGKGLSLTERVSRLLRLAIVEGELGFGENISEDRVASSLGVSRTPVRDALAILQYNGLVEVRPKRGSFVFTPSADDISALCDFRHVLEREAMALAMRHAPDELLADLETYVHAGDEMVEQRDLPAYVRLNTALHQAFFRHCGNRFLERAHELASGQLAAIRNRVMVKIEDESWFHDEHHQILAALSANDIETATKILDRHIERTRQSTLPKGIIR